MQEFLRGMIAKKDEKLDELNAQISNIESKEVTKITELMQKIDSQAKEILEKS